MTMASNEWCCRERLIRVNVPINLLTYLHTYLLTTCGLSVFIRFHWSHVWNSGQCVLHPCDLSHVWPWPTTWPDPNQLSILRCWALRHNFLYRKLLFIRLKDAKYFSEILLKWSNKALTTGQFIESIYTYVLVWNRKGSGQLVNTAIFFA